MNQNLISSEAEEELLSLWYPLIAVESANILLNNILSEFSNERALRRLKVAADSLFLLLSKSTVIEFLFGIKRTADPKRCLLAYFCGLVLEKHSQHLYATSNWLCKLLYSVRILTVLRLELNIFKIKYESGKGFFGSTLVSILLLVLKSRTWISGELALKASSLNDIPYPSKSLNALYCFECGMRIDKVTDIKFDSLGNLYHDAHSNENAKKLLLSD